MKSKEFERLHRGATENGWFVQVAPFAATFTKGSRVVTIEFQAKNAEEIEIQQCYFGKSKITLSQARNVLENL